MTTAVTIYNMHRLRDVHVNDIQFWLAYKSDGYTRRCPNVNGVLVLSLTGQWSPIAREDSWIVHNSAVARADSDESVLGFSHSPTVDSVEIFVD